MDCKLKGITTGPHDEDGGGWVTFHLEVTPTGRTVIEFDADLYLDVDDTDALHHDLFAPPTGYDVWGSEDAPTFEHWERVAWFATTPDEHAMEGVDAHISDGDPEWDGTDVDGSGSFWNTSAWAEEDDYTVDFTVIRRYRILPAGSPSPESGDQ